MDMIKKEIQKGVVLYVGSAIGMKDNKIAVDIDVADDIKEVEVWYNFKMFDTNKSFPNVEKLIIKEHVNDISIPNSLFPNVKYVDSESDAFLSGKYLVGTFYRSNMLLNAFCQKPGEIIDLTRIDGIANFAFSGCKADEMAVCDSITSFHQVSANAFVDSAFSAKPFVNGLKLAGALVLEVDKTAESIELPDTPYNYVFLETADMSHVKKLTVHHPDASNKLCFKNDVPETIVLKTDKELDFSDIAVLAHHSTSKGCLQNFSIIHPHFEEIDGVVYSKDGKKLIKFSPVRRCCNFKIPEGVEEIDAHAFDWNKHIHKIQLPETLKNLKAGTFATCEKLSTIYIPSSMEYIEDGCFADYFYTFGLVRIKDRKLPKNLIKAITPKLPKRHESGWLPASQQSKDYVVVHLIDKDSDPLEKISNCPAIERLYLPKMSEDRIDEINKYYNFHPFDSQYAEETWKYCGCNSLLSLRLAVKVFCFINDKNKDVNACIRENGFTICHFLMKDIKEELSEYVDKHHLSERLLEIKLRRINRRKEILLSIVNSGLLQEDALALVSDFIAAFDVSAIADAAAEQQKKIDKKEEKKN